MKKFFKRFKIVEQITIVLLLAVIIPSVISGIVINNINQHAVRNQLQNSAIMITEVVNNNIKTFMNKNKNELREIALALKYIPSEYSKDVYLKDILINLSEFKTLDIVYVARNNDKKDYIAKDFSYSNDSKTLTISEQINADTYLVGTLPLKNFDNHVFETFKNEKRQVYIINKDKELITALNYNENDFKATISALPEKLKTESAELFGGIKNQPLAYYKVPNSDLTIILNTTHKLTSNTINRARFKIILSVFAASLAIILLVGLYTYYLYINIRQLFKGIIALSKGNYKRKIRLLTNVFTPFEITFLASEFNKMVYEINVSYRKLKHQNRQLQELDELRGNLIDTVSHELRTPLTSIKGYTSRLLRQDINIDEETQIKSLKVIKKQTERLTRMVEDLLVIPDIEGTSLNIASEAINIYETVESAITCVKDSDDKEIFIKTKDTSLEVVADKDRLEQVFINLLENANKYAFEDSEINIKIEEAKPGKVAIKINNKAPFIEPEKLTKLMDKFIRLDDKTTRTTRGTGLGLFIVKGLVEAMNGSVKLSSSRNNIFSVEIELQKG